MRQLAKFGGIVLAGMLTFGCGGDEGPTPPTAADEEAAIQKMMGAGEQAAEDVGTAAKDASEAMQEAAEGISE